MIVADTATLTPVLIGTFGSLGGIGAIVAFLKLGSDKESAAVAQAQGANETLIVSLAAVERERDYWKQRTNELETAYEQLLKRVARDHRN